MDLKIAAELYWQALGGVAKACPAIGHVNTDAENAVLAERVRRSEELWVELVRAREEVQS